MSRLIVPRRTLRGVSIFCLISGSGVALGQPTDSNTAPGPDDQTVVVTASRVPESLDNTLWSTTVITRADIEARQASSVQELLGGVAGIDVANNGGLGKLSSVFIRGAESDHTLLLVDGVRVASATAGTAAIEFIPVDQIERIEIVRGPRSALYGTDAIGGVIQIFTRRAPQNGLSLDAEANGGNHDTRSLGTHLTARGEHAWVSIGAESFDTNGFNSCASAAEGAGACFVDEPDSDGFRNNSGSLSAGYAFNNQWSAELQSLIAEGRTEYDGSAFSGNQEDFAERVLALSLDGKLAGGWHVRAALGRNQDHQDYFLNGQRLVVFGAPASALDTDRDTASVQLDGKINQVLRLITGVEYQQDEVSGDTEYDIDSRTTKGVFGELHGDWNAWSALAGARYEDNEQFGSHVTGNVGLGRALNDRLRLTATWGTAFHAPTFNELYYPGFSNPNLKPEESRSLELGLRGRSISIPLDWSLQLFQTDIDQLIGLDAGFAVVNIDKSRIRGAELQGNWHNERWRVGGQLTRLDPVNRTDGNLLRRRAKESASLELRRIWPSFTVGAVARYQGRRFEDVANTQPLGGYVTTDLMATQSIGKAFELQARVANVLDRSYETAAFYLQDGRNYNVALRYRFAGER